MSPSVYRELSSEAADMLAATFDAPAWRAQMVEPRATANDLAYDVLRRGVYAKHGVGLDAPRPAPAPAATVDAGWIYREVEMAYSTRTLGNLRDEKRDDEARGFDVVIESHPRAPDVLLYWKRPRPAVVLPAPVAAPDDDVCAYREADAEGDDECAEQLARQGWAETRGAA